MTPAEFYEQWKGRNLTERESSQTHFRELCQLLGVPAPYDVRALDNDYKFDAITAAAGSYGPVYRPTRRPRGSQPEALFDTAPEDAPGDIQAPADRGPEQPRLTIVSAPDSRGFADVWKRGCFCWEYKRQGKHRDLNAALDQLRRYRDSLDNPPLLIVCDVDHYEIHTNFTGYPTVVYRFTAEELANPTELWLAGRGISPLHLLRKIFDRDQATEYFRPKRRLDDITAAFAGRVAQLAVQLDPAQTEDGQPITRQEVAHFLMQIVFSLFAEDVDLLPRDRVTRLLQQGNEEPKGFTRRPTRDLRRRRRQELVRHRALHPRHPLRARPGPEEALPDRRPLHQP
jgi:hypothetical protein